ncbi:hypothetical protein [Mangrovicoccus sp. HB161399]|uniref:hypothetical protein n=1 Tax=Mangrovicoccus sp. HB161399 TaxID=2720392 RepID=UPI001555DBA1|nr:hypothetical protein [Mangrovicoccus sp. HB161399]
MPEDSTADENAAASGTGPSLTQQEYALRRYEARIGLWKVIWGTAAVGILSVLVPGAIEFWKTTLEVRKLAAQQELERTQFEYETRRAFIDTALNQDIELRLRFATYFSKTLGNGMNSPWSAYEKALRDLRDEKRKQIHELERDFRSLAGKEEDSASDQAELAELERKLEWAYKEIGYVERGRSVVKSRNETQQSVPTEPLNNAVLLEMCASPQEDMSLRWLCTGAKVLGLHEGRDNSRLREFLSSDGRTLGDPENLPWEGDFVETVVALNDPEADIPQNPYLSRNWLQFGEPTKSPRPGDILVFWRGSVNGTAGHVGFYAGEDETNYHVLGGNQSNAVDISRVAKDRLLGARTSRKPLQPAVPQE